MKKNVYKSVMSLECLKKIHFKFTQHITSISLGLLNDTKSLDMN